MLRNIQGTSSHYTGLGFILAPNRGVVLQAPVQAIVIVQRLHFQNVMLLPALKQGNNGNPCANGGCSHINHRHDDGSFGSGPCPSSVGGTSCHNYCGDGATGSGYYGWC
jgi:hypothetical protein